MNRNTTLDYLRGVAITSIVVGHLFFYSNRADGSILWNICNSLQIPIFIYVSGLLANKSIQKYDFIEFLKKRIFRLIIPFISFFLLWLIIRGITIENIITFITDEFKQGFWFLIVLFELTFIHSFNHFVSKKHNTNRIVLDIFAFIIINTYHFLVKDFEIFNQLFCLNLLWHYYPLFLVGVYSEKIHKLFTIRLSSLYFIIYAISFYLLFFKGVHFMLAICNTSSLFFLVAIFNNEYKIAESAFTKAGQYSLEIYLLHILIIDIIMDYIPIFENRWIEAIVYIPLAGTICYMFIRFASILKKSKVVNLLLFGG